MEFRNLFPLTCFIVSTLFTTGCQSAWEKFYTGYDYGNNSYVPAYTGVTQVYRVSSLAECKSIQNNYNYTLGESNFWCSPGWANDCSYESLQKYGEKTGADAVVYFVENVNSETHYRTTTTYTPAPSQTYISGYNSGNQFYGTATTYGGGGYATSRTTPYNVYSGEFHAVFLRGRR